MIASTDAFKAVMKSERATVYVKVELLDKNERVLEEITSIAYDGSISVDTERDVRRQFSLTLDNQDGRFTWSPGGLVWLDKRIKLHIGLETPSGIEYVPQGVFLLTEPVATSEVNGTRAVRLQGGDKWTLIDGNPLGRFTYTTKILKGTTITKAIRELAELAGETKFALDDSTVKVPYDLTYQAGTARGKAIKELAELAVFNVYYDVNGFLRMTPKLQDLTKRPVSWTYDHRETMTLYAGGSRGLSGEIFNKVVVVGGSLQTGTVSTILAHDDPRSPYSTVNIGERVFQYNNGSPDPLITTKADADARAKWELQRLVGYTEKLAFKIVPNYLHEAGDVIIVKDEGNGSDGVYEVLRFTINLSPGGWMLVDARRVTTPLKEVA